jgi:hypothetical protein
VLRFPTCERYANHTGAHEAMHTVDHVASRTRRQWLLTWTSSRFDMPAQDVSLDHADPWHSIVPPGAVLDEVSDGLATFEYVDAEHDCLMFYVVCGESGAAYGPTTQPVALIERLRKRQGAA